MHRYFDQSEGALRGFTRGTRRAGSRCLDGKAGEFVSRSRAGWMVRCKMTQGRVNEAQCLLDLTISLRLSLTRSEQRHLKRWVSAGPVGLAEWQKASWSGLS